MILLLNKGSGLVSLLPPMIVKANSQYQVKQFAHNFESKEQVRFISY
jgi:hypothetical protein